MFYEFSSFIYQYVNVVTLDIYLYFYFKIMLVRQIQCVDYFSRETEQETLRCDVYALPFATMNRLKTKTQLELSVNLTVSMNKSDSLTECSNNNGYI